MLDKNNITTKAKRVILFRGWNKKNKKWLYGYYLVNRGEHFISPDEFVNPLASYEDYVVEADTVGQYTGLTDAKGVKIFEGDVIRGKGYEYAIQYDEKNACFVAVSLKNYLSSHRIYKNWLNAHEMVIIRNVHGKSELIKTE